MNQNSELFKMKYLEFKGPLLGKTMPQINAQIINFDKMVQSGINHGLFINNLQISKHLPHPRFILK